MLRKFAVIAVFTTMLLLSCDRTEAQMIGRPLGPSGGFGAGPVGPLGGSGGIQEPLRLSSDSTTPTLRGTLPVIQTPELELPPGSGPAIAVNGQTDPRHQDAPATPVGSVTSDQRDVRQDLAEVNDLDEISQQPAVAVSGGVPDNEGEDDDQDEGDLPWWVWLLLVAGVVMVVRRVRG